MARDDLHFRLRIPEALKERIQAAAAQSHRSMTAEIVHRLEQSFAERISIGPSSPAQPGEPVTTQQEEVRAVVNELADALKVFLGAAVKNRTGEALSEEDMRNLSVSLGDIVRPPKDKST